MKQPSPRSTLPSTLGKDSLANQSSDKRQRISHQKASMPTQQHQLERLEASIPRDTQKSIVKPIASPYRNTAIIRDYLDPETRENTALQQQLRDYSNGMSTFDSRRNYMLYTKAAVLSTQGIVELGVKIDGSSVRNLLLRSIASRLRLPLFLGKSIRISVAHHIIQMNQYSQFSIQVADVETTIDAYVVWQQ